MPNSLPKKKPKVLASTKLKLYFADDKFNLALSYDFCLRHEGKYCEKTFMFSFTDKHALFCRVLKIRDCLGKGYIVIRLQIRNLLSLRNM